RWEPCASFTGRGAPALPRPEAAVSRSRLRAPIALDPNGARYLAQRGDDFPSGRSSYRLRAAILGAAAWVGSSWQGGRKPHVPASTAGSRASPFHRPKSRRRRSPDRGAAARDDELRPVANRDPTSIYPDSG